MLKKDQNPASDIWYAQEFPALSRVFIVLDKVFWDFSRNRYHKTSLPFYTVHVSDYENLKICQAIKNYHLNGETRINYGALDLWAVQKNRNGGGVRLPTVDFDVYIAVDRFVSRWPEKVHEIITNLHDLGKYYAFSLKPVNSCLYRLVLGGCYGDLDGREAVPLQRPSRLTSDEL